MILGIAAATASVVSFVPQAWKVVRTRKTDELATGMWLLNVIGFALWTTYGVTRSQWPIIVPNTICFLLAGFILVMKLVSSSTKHAIADKLDPKAERPSTPAS